MSNGRRTVYMKNPLIVKQYEDTNLLAQMFQSCNAVEEIADTFVDIIDKIIIDPGLFTA